MKNFTKSATLAIKQVGDAGQFEGYASTFDVVDLGDDIVVKGAYAKSLRERGARGIKMLHAHDPCEPIGVWEDLREDDVGLFARGRLLIDDIAKSREVYALMKAGAIDGLSIGYRVINASRDPSTSARRLEEVDLREISVVTFPMNETSLISAVKGQLPTEREFERFLTQDAGFSRSQARLIISDGFKALSAAKPGAVSEGHEDVDWDAVARSLSDLSEQINS